MSFGLNPKIVGSPILSQGIYADHQPPCHSFIGLRRTLKAGGGLQNVGGRGQANWFLLPRETMAAKVLKTQYRAKAKGYSDVIYLDAINKKYLEEVSSCNIFVLKSILQEWRAGRSFSGTIFCSYKYSDRFG